MRASGPGEKIWSVISPIWEETLFGENQANPSGRGPRNQQHLGRRPESKPRKFASKHSRSTRDKFYPLNQHQTKPRFNVFFQHFFTWTGFLSNFRSFCQNLSQNLKFSLKTSSPSQSYAKNDGKSRKIKTGQKVHHTLLRQLSYPARVCLQHEGKTILNVVKPESASSLRLSHWF